MDTARIAAQLGARLIVLCAVVAASAAFGQTPMPTNERIDGAPVPPGTTLADVRADPGLPGPASVDPAPGAVGPYANESKHAFYDVRQRIANVQSRIAANLTGAEQRKAMREIDSIKSEEKDQIARHGDLLDWARENLNHRLDALLQAHPALRASAAAAG
jgi:hypothetical protein